MVRVRELLVEWRGKSFITYGCSAHYMNLVQNEASPPGIKAHLVEVQKFFRNHHKQSAQLKAKGGKRPHFAKFSDFIGSKLFLIRSGFLPDEYLLPPSMIQIA